MVGGELETEVRHVDEILCRVRFLMNSHVSGLVAVAKEDDIFQKTSGKASFFQKS